MADHEITMEGLLAAAEEIAKIPAAPVKLRMNLTTLAYIGATLAKSGPEPIPPWKGLPVFSDNGLATGIVEVDWSDGRTETLDLMTRSV